MTLTSLRVLVVEDHGFQRRMALRLMAELGLEHALEAADGVAALALLETQAQPPDVVLVDLDMPGMDGIEFIGHVAQRRLARGVALVSALDPALLNTVQTMARAYGLRVPRSCAKRWSTARSGRGSSRRWNSATARWSGSRRLRAGCARTGT